MLGGHKGAITSLRWVKKGANPGASTEGSSKTTIQFASTPSRHTLVDGIYMTTTQPLEDVNHNPTCRNNDPALASKALSLRCSAYSIFKEKCIPAGVANQRLRAQLL